MTIESTVNDGVTHAGNASATNFSFPFKVNLSTQVEVIIRDSAGVETTLSSNYTVNNHNVEGSGSVDYPTSGSPLPVGSKITINPKMDYKQETDIRNQGPFAPETHEDAFDTAMMHIKELRGLANRTVQFKKSSEITGALFDDDPVDGYGLVWDGTTGKIRNTTASLATLETNAGIVAGISADVTTVAGISADVTTVAGISGNVTTVAGISGNVTTVAGISANVTTVAGISGNVTTVAGDSSDIQTLAPISADIQTLADIEDGTVATDAISDLAAISGNVTTVAGIAANVTTVAGISGNVTTVAGISANVTTVAGIAADVTTCAGIAADITNAANNIPKANLTATTDPTVNDDSSDGYQEGSKWVNITLGKVFFLTDDTVGAAVWVDINPALYPTIGGSDAYKILQVNAGSTAYELKDEIRDIKGVIQRDTTSLYHDIYLDASSGNISICRHIGDDSASNDTIYLQERGVIVTNTNGAEDGKKAFDVMKGGTLNSDFFSIGYDGVKLGGEELVHKNYLINSNFDIWQRGTSFSITSGQAYTADRWLVVLGTTAQIAANRQTFTAGQTDVPGEPSYYIDLNRTVAGSAASTFEQRIEDVRSLAGETITISFYAKCNTGSFDVNTDLFQNFGSGGSASVDGADKTHTLTTSWQKFTHTYTNFANISGKTIGAGSYLAMRFIWAHTEGATDQIQIAQLKVEKGSVETEYVPSSLEQELASCQRYFEKSYDQVSAPGAVVANGQLLSFAHDAFTVQCNEQHLKVTKRAVPTITPYSPTTGASGKAWSVSAGADVNMSSSNVGDAQFRYDGGGSLTAGHYYLIHYTAEAEL
jgi:hypothetical protein